jgi:DNA polymerase III epsilon subunit-like protein
MNLTTAIHTTFDFETTGLFAWGRGGQICEIGALRFGPDGAVKKYEQMVDPLRPISAKAYEMNQISPEMVKGQPTIDEVLTEFRNFIGTQGSRLDT